MQKHGMQQQRAKDHCNVNAEDDENVIGITFLDLTIYTIVNAFRSKI